MLFFTSHSMADAHAFIITQQGEIAKSIDRSILKEILTGKKIYWNNGTRVKICHVNSNNEEFKAFLTDVLSMSSDQYINLWRRKLFTGRGLPPKQLATEELVISCVKNNSSSIGIIFHPAKTDLKVINY